MWCYAYNNFVSLMFIKFMLTTNGKETEIENEKCKFTNNSFFTQKIKTKCWVFYLPQNLDIENLT
jgi:hypothetical protein